MIIEGIAVGSLAVELLLWVFEFPLHPIVQIKQVAGFFPWHACCRVPKYVIEGRWPLHHLV